MCYYFCNRSFCSYTLKVALLLLIIHHCILNSNDVARLCLIIAYDNNTGASASIATKYFKRNTGCTFDAMYSVKMPDNLTPVFGSDQC